MESSGSTVPRRMLGRQLRQLREKAGVTVAQACRTIEVSPQTMWRLEGGQGVKLKDIYVKALCELYRSGDEEIIALMGLVQETKRTGWWHAYGDAVPTYFDLYLGLEESAQKLTTYHLTLLPGMLQTAAYRRAVIWGAYPGMPTADVERRIEIAAQRQKRLQEPRNHFGMNAFLGEAALRYRVGGSAIIAEQLRHIVAVSRMPTATVRIVPLGIETISPLITGSFTLLEFAPHTHFTEPPVVYVEGYTGALYLDKPGEIDQYKLALKAIRGAALSEQETRELVLNIVEEFE
ncbi:MAG: family transcriptional regulator [Nocardia sp.]|uniref:helix-turn-helix domain-containing protein n=1 Tax=Nocardia sp. TaxID=1821 RepID=UPI00262B721F|nr:helix-turn-helix transcriptional regulator [Nocardia sp.]MCU1644517.1 family transcriptional regulator [Nocardia sp.]